MSITDHVAILLHAALDAPQPSKAKPGKIEYYARFAFQPAAVDDLLALCTAAAPNGSTSGLQLPPKLHSSLHPDKRFPGIPLDWYIVRMASVPDYPPELYAVDGTKLAALPINRQQIRTELYAGQRVRVNTYGFHYPATNGGNPGVGFNLSGVMAVGGGERMAGGDRGESSDSAFAKYRSDAPAQTGTGAATSGGDAFGGSGAPANNAGANGSNPFSQPSSGGPFG